MEKKLQYMGYTAKLEYSAEDGVYLGRLENINGLVNFEGETPEAAEAAFRGERGGLHRIFTGAHVGDGEQYDFSERLEG